MYNIGPRKETFTHSRPVGVVRVDGDGGPNKFGKWIVSFNFRFAK